MSESGNRILGAYTADGEMIASLDSLYDIDSKCTKYVVNSYFGIGMRLSHESRPNAIRDYHCRIADARQFIPEIYEYDYKTEKERMIYGKNR